MLSKYQKLDALILDAIRSGASQFEELLQAPGEIAQEADLIARQENNLPRKGYHEVEGWRVVDRRLQALRKAGRILYRRGKSSGWACASANASDE